VWKKLDRLHSDKAADTDDLAPRFLNELKGEICLFIDVYDDCFFGVRSGSR